jgi:NTE family protein
MNQNAPLRKKQLYIIMSLMMVLWVLLQWTTRDRVVISPVASGTNPKDMFQEAPYPTKPQGGKKYRLGVALSGGGAKGFCHLGVLKAMDDAGIKPDILAGVSAGSVVAALYADGYSTDSILSMYDRLNFMEYLSVNLNEGGLLSLKRFKTFLDQTLRAKTFEELKIPLRVVVTDLDHGTSVIFDKGPLTDALVASCSVPILFDPWVINGVHYVDGGLMHNLPAYAIRSDCKFLMGVSLAPIQADPYDKSIMTIALRSYRFIFRSNANYDKSLCDLVVEPVGIGQYGAADVNEVKQIYKVGYDAFVQVLDSIGKKQPRLLRKLKIH